MARRRFFVDEIHSGHARVLGDEAHHLTRVLRVEAGQKFEISDNHNVYLAQVASARKDVVDFAVIERIEHVEPCFRLALLASLIRFERFELLIEKATELGVETIVPVEADRSEKGLDRAAAKRITRWNRIAREASEQSRRVQLPVIEPAVKLAEALRVASRYRYMLEESGAPPILSVLPKQRGRHDTIALLAGPEGGWTERERAAITRAEWQPVSLGATILKTETAVIAALAILNAAWDATTEGDSSGRPWRAS